MSLAASIVETWASSGPPLAAHVAAKALALAAKACSSALVSGVGSAPRNASSWRSSRQVTGWEDPTPRGSNPTMS